MYNAIENTLLVKFLPIATRRALEQIVEECGAAAFVETSENQRDPIKIIVDENAVTISIYISDMLNQAMILMH